MRNLRNRHSKEETIRIPKLVRSDFSAFGVLSLAFVSRAARAADGTKGIRPRRDAAGIRRPSAGILNRGMLLIHTCMSLSGARPE
jgi:hypothetical protein